MLRYLEFADKILLIQQRQTEASYCFKICLWCDYVKYYV